MMTTEQIKRVQNSIRPAIGYTAGLSNAGDYWRLRCVPVGGSYRDHFVLEVVDADAWDITSVEGIGEAEMSRVVDGLGKLIN
ncbi:MAG: hypothetical protein HQK57_02250 [Deltaproteobacteria bacterium]|nr:hypothetical protein [Deltaproteobacteria bacterium]MBF0527448.1 hypothetical protein [Deltaproteobacteria bacterium]